VDADRLGNLEKHTAMADNAFFGGAKTVELRFSDRSNARPYNALADPEPNRAEQNNRKITAKTANNCQRRPTTANASQRFWRFS
jgi:hypothetical protein